VTGRRRGGRRVTATLAMRGWSNAGEEKGERDGNRNGAARGVGPSEEGGQRVVGNAGAAVGSTLAVGGVENVSRYAPAPTTGDAEWWRVVVARGGSAGCGGAGVW